MFEVTVNVNATVHVHHHDNGVALAGVLKKLEELQMAVSQDIKDLSKKIDDATNVIADELKDLQAKIKNSMTDAELADVKQALQGNIDKLTGLGANPDNPVPAVTP